MIQIEEASLMNFFLISVCVYICMYVCMCIYIYIQTCIYVLLCHEKKDILPYSTKQDEFRVHYTK